MQELSIPAPGRAKSGAKGRGLTFAVYAAIGTDPRLSRFPATSTTAPIPPIHKQALVKELARTAAEGVNVAALVDVYGDDTYLVEIPAYKPLAISIVSAWKQNMSDPHALAGFLRRAHQRFPCDALVLAVDSHGAGFIPDLDLNRINQDSLTHWDSDGSGRRVRWTVTGESTRFQFEAAARAAAADSPPDRGVTSPEMGAERGRPAARADDDEAPPLGVTTPEMGVDSAALPFGNLPMSTWAYGEALRLAVKAGVPRPAVIAFNNCFNASFELLHTVSPYAGYAAAYANYDFFSAGATYPVVFHKLRMAGSATAAELAKWFVQVNGQLMQAKQNHPLIGATVDLRRMRKVATALNRLGELLVPELRGANEAAVRQRVKAAAIAAQHYDTEPGFELKVPDQFVDVAGFADALRAQFGPGDIRDAAVAVRDSVAGIWQFGDKDWPWMGQDPNIVWDFTDRKLGMNIYFPDPALEGRWDWRSPYYLSGRVDPTLPPAHLHVIPFLAETGGVRARWVEFIVAYHEKTQFLAFLPPRQPVFPIFNREFKPGGGGGDNPPGTPTGPGGPTAGGPKRR